MQDESKKEQKGRFGQQISPTQMPEIEVGADTNTVRKGRFGQTVKPTEFKPVEKFVEKAIVDPIKNVEYLAGKYMGAARAVGEAVGLVEPKKEEEPKQDLLEVENPLLDSKNFTEIEAGSIEFMSNAIADTYGAIYNSNIASFMGSQAERLENEIKGTKDNRLDALPVYMNNAEVGNGYVPSFLQGQQKDLNAPEVKEQVQANLDKMKKTYIEAEWKAQEYQADRSKYIQDFVGDGYIAMGTEFAFGMIDYMGNYENAAAIAMGNYLGAAGVAMLPQAIQAMKYGRFLQAGLSVGINAGADVVTGSAMDWYKAERYANLAENRHLLSDETYEIIKDNTVGELVLGVGASFMQGAFKEGLYQGVSASQNRAVYKALDQAIDAGLSSKYSDPNIAIKEMSTAINAGNAHTSYSIIKTPEGFKAVTAIEKAESIGRPLKGTNVIDAYGENKISYMVNGEIVGKPENVARAMENAFLGDEGITAQKTFTNAALSTEVNDINTKYSYAKDPYLMPTKPSIVVDDNFMVNGVKVAEKAEVELPRMSDDKPVTPIYTEDPKYVYATYRYRDGDITIETPKAELTNGAENSGFVRFRDAETSSRVFITSLDGEVRVLTGKEKEAFNLSGKRNHDTVNLIVESVLNIGRETENMQQDVARRESQKSKSMPKTPKDVVGRMADTLDHTENRIITDIFDGKVETQKRALSREKKTILDNIARKGGYDSLTQMFGDVTPGDIARSIVSGEEIRGIADLSPEKANAIREVQKQFVDIWRVEKDKTTQIKHKNRYIEDVENDIVRGGTVGDVVKNLNKLYDYDDEGNPKIKTDANSEILAQGEDYAKIFMLTNRHLADDVNYNGFKDIGLNDSGDASMHSYAFETEATLGGRGFSLMQQKGLLGQAEMDMLMKYGMLKYDEIGNPIANVKSIRDGWKAMAKDLGNMSGADKATYNKITKAFADKNTFPKYITYENGARLETNMGMMDWVTTVKDGREFSKQSRADVLSKVAKETKSIIDLALDMNDRFQPELKELKADASRINEVSGLQSKLDKLMAILESDKVGEKQIANKQIQTIVDDIKALNDKYNLGISDDVIYNIQNLTSADKYKQWMGQKAELENQIKSTYNSIAENVDARMEQVKAKVLEQKAELKPQIDEINAWAETEINNAIKANEDYKTAKADMVEVEPPEYAQYRIDKEQYDIDMANYNEALAKFEADKESVETSNKQRTEYQSKLDEYNKKVDDAVAKSQEETKAIELENQKIESQNKKIESENLETVNTFNKTYDNWNRMVEKNEDFSKIQEAVDKYPQLYADLPDYVKEVIDEPVSIDVKSSDIDIEQLEARRSEIEKVTQGVHDSISDKMIDNIDKTGKPMKGMKEIYVMREGQFSIGDITIDDDMPLFTFSTAQQKRDAISEIVGLVKDRMSEYDLESNGLKTDANIEKEILKQFQPLNDNTIGWFNKRGEDNPNKIPFSELEGIVEQIQKQNKNKYEAVFESELSQARGYDSEYMKLTKQIDDIRDGKVAPNAEVEAKAKYDAEVKEIEARNKKAMDDFEKTKDSDIQLTPKQEAEVEAVQNVIDKYPHLYEELSDKAKSIVGEPFGIDADIAKVEKLLESGDVLRTKGYKGTLKIDGKNISIEIPAGIHKLKDIVSVVKKSLPDDMQKKATTKQLQAMALRLSQPQAFGIGNIRGKSKVDPDIAKYIADKFGADVLEKIKKSPDPTKAADEWADIQTVLKKIEKYKIGEKPKPPKLEEIPKFDVAKYAPETTKQLSPMEELMLAAEISPEFEKVKEYRRLLGLEPKQPELKPLLEKKEVKTLTREEAQGMFEKPVEPIAEIREDLKFDMEKPIAPIEPSLVMKKGAVDTPTVEKPETVSAARKRIAKEKKQKLESIKSRAKEVDGIQKSINEAAKDIKSHIKKNGKNAKNIIDDTMLNDKVGYINTLTQQMLGDNAPIITLDDIINISEDYKKVMQFKEDGIKSISDFKQNVQNVADSRNLESQKFQNDYYHNRVDELNDAWRDLRKSVPSDPDKIEAWIKSEDYQTRRAELAEMMDELGIDTTPLNVIDSAIGDLKLMDEAINRGGVNPVLNGGDGGNTIRKKEIITHENDRLLMNRLGSVIKKQSFLSDLGWFKEIEFDMGDGTKGRKYAFADVDSIADVTPEVYHNMLSNDKWADKKTEALYNKCNDMDIDFGIVQKLEDGTEVKLEPTKEQFAYWYYRLLQDLNKTKEVTGVWQSTHKKELGNLNVYFASPEEMVKFFTIDEPEIGRGGYIKSNEEMIGGYFNNDLDYQASYMTMGMTPVGMMNRLPQSKFYKDAVDKYSKAQGNVVAVQSYLFDQIRDKLNKRADQSRRGLRAEDSSFSSTSRKIVGGLMKLALARSGSKESIVNSIHPQIRSIDILGTRGYLQEVGKGWISGVPKAAADILDYRKTGSFIEAVGRMADNEKMIYLGRKMDKTPIGFNKDGNAMLKAEMELDTIINEMSYKDKAKLEKFVAGWEQWAMGLQQRSEWDRKSVARIVADKDLAILRDKPITSEEVMNRFIFAEIGEKEIPKYQQIMKDIYDAGVNIYDLNAVEKMLGVENRESALKVSTLANNILEENYRSGRKHQVEPNAKKDLLTQILGAFRGFVVTQGREDLNKIFRGVTKYGTVYSRIDYGRDGFFKTAKNTLGTGGIMAAHFAGGGLATVMNSNMLKYTMGGIGGLTLLAKTVGEGEGIYSDMKQGDYSSLRGFLWDTMLSAIANSTLTVYTAGGNIVGDVQNDIKQLKNVWQSANFYNKSTTEEERQAYLNAGVTPDVWSLKNVRTMEGAVLRFTGLGNSFRGVVDFATYYSYNDIKRKDYRDSVIKSLNTQFQDYAPNTRQYPIEKVNQMFDILEDIRDGAFNVTKEFAKAWEEEDRAGSEEDAINMETYMKTAIATSEAMGEITSEQAESAREDLGRDSIIHTIFERAPKQAKDFYNKMESFFGLVSEYDKAELKQKITAYTANGMGFRDMADELTNNKSNQVDKYTKGADKLIGRDKEKYNEYVAKGIDSDKVLRAISQELTDDQLEEVFAEEIMVREDKDSNIPEHIKENKQFEFTDNVVQNTNANMVYPAVKKAALESGVDPKVPMANWAFNTEYGTEGVSQSELAKENNAIFGVEAKPGEPSIQIPVKASVSYDKYSNELKDEGYKIVGAEEDGKVKVEGVKTYKKYDTIEDAAKDYVNTVKHKPIQEVAGNSKEIQVVIRDYITDNIFKIEGGYLNDPQTGEISMYGVTEEVARASGYKGDMRALPKELALKIYQEQYHAPIAKLTSDPAAQVVLTDIAVNSGVGIARSYFRRFGNDVGAMLAERIPHYKRIAEKEPAKRKYLKGWLNRVEQLAKMAKNVYTHIESQIGKFDVGDSDLVNAPNSMDAFVSQYSKSLGKYGEYYNKNVVNAENYSTEGMTAQVSSQEATPEQVATVDKVDVTQELEKSDSEITPTEMAFANPQEDIEIKTKVDEKDIPTVTQQIIDSKKEETKEDKTLGTEIPEAETARVSEVEGKSQGEFRDDIEKQLVSLLTNKPIEEMDVPTQEKVNNMTIGELAADEMKSQFSEVPKEEVIPEGGESKLPPEHEITLSNKKKEIIGSLMDGIELDDEVASNAFDLIKDDKVPQAAEKIESIKNIIKSTKVKAETEQEKTETPVVDKISKKAKPFDPKTTKYEDIGKDFEVEPQSNENPSDKPTGRKMYEVEGDGDFEYTKRKDFSAISINISNAKQEATIKLREKYGDIVAISEKEWLAIKGSYRKDYRAELDKIKAREGAEFFGFGKDKESNKGWTPADIRYHNRVDERFGKSSDRSIDENTRIAPELKAYEKKVENAYKKEKMEEDLVIKRDLEKGIAHNVTGELALIKKEIEKLTKGMEIKEIKEVMKTKKYKDLKKKESEIQKRRYAE